MSISFGRFFICCGFVLIMLASAFTLIFAFFPLVFVVAIHSFRMYVQEFPHILCLFDSLLFCEHELYGTSYSGVWFLLDRKSRLNRERGFLSLGFLVRIKKFPLAR